MTSKDNSVNIESKRDRYHHGDLGDALVAEGLRQLAEGDLEQLSLRGIARNVGVSATAVYRHFPDKSALLAALCVEGDKRLTEASRKAQVAAGGGKAGFDATGRAYVRFALDNPALFRLMMSHFHALYGDALGGTTSAGFGLLLDNIAALTPAGTDPGTRRVIALQSWAIVHGLATLMLDGVIPRDDDLIDQVILTPDFRKA